MPVSLADYGNTFSGRIVHGTLEDGDKETGIL